MNTTFPRLRALTQSLGIYRPVHKAFIALLLARVGVLVRPSRRGLVLRKGSKRICVRDWDTAAIAAYSFDVMYDAVEPDAKGLVDYSQPSWHTLRRTNESWFFTSIADLEVDSVLATYVRGLTPGSVVLHVGAYCGVQTVELSRAVGPAGRVVAFEPDPSAYRALTLNLEKRGVQNVVARNEGLWREKSTLTFFATQGMHSSFTNAPSHAHAKTEIAVVSADGVVQELGLTRVDLFKIDAEGHEAVLLSALSVDAWKRVDAFVEIGTPENARAVFDRFVGTGINIFAQKRGWARVESIDDVPVSYKEGGVFVSAKQVMPWHA
jgi:FkbM family methyltransferase